MLLTRAKCKEMSAALHTARLDPANHCQSPHTKDGKSYRLEPKPRGRREVIEKYGHECVDVDGVLHVRVPLGVHGPDHLAINPETGEIACMLCQGDK